jgi:hypothetical protein
VERSVCLIADVEEQLRPRHKGALHWPIDKLRETRVEVVQGMRAPTIKILFLATMKQIGEFNRCLIPQTIGLEIAKWAAELRVCLVPPTTHDRVGVSNPQLRDDQSRTLQPLKKVVANIRSVDPQPPDLALKRCSVNVAPSEVVDHTSRPDLVD